MIFEHVYGTRIELCTDDRDFVHAIGAFVLAKKRMSKQLSCDDTSTFPRNSKLETIVAARPNAVVDFMRESAAAERGSPRRWQLARSPVAA